jgi:hypothetical protein
MCMAIILLQDLYDIKKRKQKELEFYKSQLEALQVKMAFIRQEIILTEKIISMIRSEEVIDISKHIKESNERT